MVIEVEPTTWVGMCGTLLAFALFIPQAARSWSNRRRPERLKGVSLLGQVLVLANAIVWAVYAILAEALWTGAPGLVNAPLAIFSIIILLRGRRKVVPDRSCGACNAGIPHSVFITGPPGFGSIMPCSWATRRSGAVIFSDEDARALRNYKR